MELKVPKGADAHWVYHAPQKLDQVIGEYKLFLPLMRILELSTDDRLI